MEQTTQGCGGERWLRLPKVHLEKPYFRSQLVPNSRRPGQERHLQSLGSRSFSSVMADSVCQLSKLMEFVCSNASLDVAAKIYFRCSQHEQSVDFA